jgi:AraC family transcriptional regulator, dual regulator of chb operon
VPDQENDEMPAWLKHTLNEMSKPENIREGLAALERLSGKTPEHTSRMFKKFLCKTPTDYINNLKTNYAANLLLHSDEDIVNIAFSAGFDNLSHFYHVFKQYFSTSPGKYRNLNKNIYIL